MWGGDVSSLVGMSFLGSHDAQWLERNPTGKKFICWNHRGVSKHRKINIVHTVSSDLVKLKGVTLF